jgi:hypothetical protein
MKPRTRIEFKFAGDPAPVIERWAAENGFQAAPLTGTRQLYQKGLGIVVAPMMLQVDRQGDDVVIEAWIRFNQFVRAMSLFILPAEVGVESGGFIAVVPRTIARNAVNKLMPLLKQPRIG